MGRYLALVPMALALAACGGGGGGGALSLDPVASAAEKTSKQETSKIEFTMSSSGFRATGTGAADDDSMRMSMDFRYKGKSTHLTVVVVGDTFYVSSPIFRKDPTYPKGKDWFKLDMKAAAKAQGIDFDSLTPSNELDVLGGSTGKPRKIGAERVRGVETTHYEATIDLDAAAAKASGKTGEALRKMVGASGTKTIPFEVWVDKHRLVRRMAFSERLGPGKPSVRLVLTLYDFGAPVSIKAPPSDKVFDATKYATP